MSNISAHVGMPTVSVFVRDVMTETLLHTLADKVDISGITSSPSSWSIIPLTNDVDAVTIGSDEFLEVLFHSSAPEQCDLQLENVFLDVTVE